MKLDLQEHTHRRLNPLTGEWILVSPHRAKRPWQGRQEPAPSPSRPRYDSDCYLCPGNKRASGEVNPDYDGTYVFENDFAALIPDSLHSGDRDDELMTAVADRGSCSVVCFSPYHDVSMSRLGESAIEGVVSRWVEEYRRMSDLAHIGNIQIFENKGEIMGCSNPHPHGQIWANEKPPTLPGLEFDKQQSYLERRRSCMLCDYLERELREGERIVAETDEFVVLVPFWAVWPFETMILPRNHRSSISEFTGGERRDLAIAIRLLCTKYDNLFETEFPYSMGIHQAGTTADRSGVWHSHLHYLPPLLRSATVKKFMVGYELLAMPQRDITSEVSADRLRGLSPTHYLG